MKTTLKRRNLCGVLAAAMVLVAGTALVHANQTTAGPECKTYKPCISYCGCCDCCGPKVNQVLKVKDPCDCCCELAEIPVCLPACCKKACVSSRCALFGRGIVTYSYDCGCCVTIVFRRCGDVVVKYS